MIATVDKPDWHFVLPNIQWRTFERILDDLGARRFRFTYLDGELEFMTTSLEHESFGAWIGRLIFFVALEMGVPIKSGGSTTLKRAMRKVGLEPDECFWLHHEKAMRGKKKWNALTDPPPDLAVEIDITSSWLDRLEVYAGLKVPEVWRFDGKTFRILILNDAGKYKEKSRSAAFPYLPMAPFVRFIKKLDSADETELIREFTHWLRAEVVSLKGARKNGQNGA